MKRTRLILLLLIVLTSVATALAQEPIPDQGFLERLVGSSRETILNRKPAGPYYVSISGERFPDKGYFLMQIDEPNSGDVSALAVQLTFTPLMEDSETPGELASGTPIVLNAVYDRGTFVVNPIPTSGATGWSVDIAVTDTQGTYTTEFTTFLWPRSPVLPVPLAIGALLLPVSLVGIVLLGFRWRRIPLVVTPA